MRITRQKAEAVAAALAKGLTQRSVAQLVGVSRGTVQAIANGTRGLWGVEEGDDRQPAGHRGYVTGEGFTEDDRRVCPGCGYLATTPCVACAAKRHLFAEGRAA